MKKKQFRKPQFMTQWIRHFTRGIPRQDLEKYVTSPHNYIWHIFSWELLPEGSYLSGDAARQAYDEIDKTGALYVEPFVNSLCNTVTPELSKASELDKRREIYVAAPDFSWTYIKTHEDGLCGPYFYRKDPSC